MNIRQKLLLATDRLLTALIVTLVCGSALCFGGAVWWFRLVFALLVFLLSLTMLVRLLLECRMPFLRSPLTLLGFLTICLGFLQLIPLPAFFARRLSPVAQQIYSFGLIPSLAGRDFPALELDTTAKSRSPATLDRSNTLRWLFDASAYLGVFWTVSHFADRRKRMYIVWGCVLMIFLINGAFGWVQIAGRVHGLYGHLEPGKAPIWAPSVSDLLDSPASTRLRYVNDVVPLSNSETSRAAMMFPDQSPLMGTMMGGYGGFLAFGSFALPLGLAIVLHTLSPRGSRETITFRLSHTGQGSMIVLLLFLLFSCGLLVGMVTGLAFCTPFIVGLAIVGIPSAFGLRDWSVGLTALLFASLGLGVAFTVLWPAIFGGVPPISRVSWDAAQVVWSASLAIFHEFPIVGTGLGSFSTIHPYFKFSDSASTTAMSSLVQWGVESGAIGLAILAAMVLWSLTRLPSSLQRVGSADRPLAYGMIGAAVGFTLWSALHWAVELPAVAISASALAGTWNRWLAGGTDLFVERG